MSFKKMSRLSFADIALFKSMDRNRAIMRMEKINSVVNWSRIESLVLRDYPPAPNLPGVARLSC